MRTIIAMAIRLRLRLRRTASASIKRPASACRSYTRDRRRLWQRRNALRQLIQTAERIALLPRIVDNPAERVGIILRDAVQQNDRARMKLPHDVAVRIVRPLLGIHVPILVCDGPEYVRI